MSKIYRYETHLHTSETSHCGHQSAEDQVLTYKSLGYDGICVTDHILQKYIDDYYFDCKDNWEACADRFLAGYHAAKKIGDSEGLDVILGLEIRFEGVRDYLLYGFDEDWLYRNPFVTKMSLPDFYDKFKDEILIIQAHPFRDNNVCMWQYVHGLEIANSSPRHDSRDMLACRVAMEHPDLVRIAGSDAHRVGDEGKTAVIFNRRIKDSFEFADALRKKEFEIWCPGSTSVLNMKLGYL